MRLASLGLRMIDRRDGNSEADGEIFNVVGQGKVLAHPLLAGGAELATVVIGGLMTSTMLTLVVIPVIYSLLRRDRAPAGAPAPAAGAPAPAAGAGAGAPEA